MPQDPKPQLLQVYPVQIAPEENEINLVDIWLGLRKHRKAFLGTFFGILALGLLVILLLPRTYELTTALEIGSSDQSTPIEKPETVKAKLENAFIPLVVGQFTGEQQEPEQYEVRVQIPKKSSLVVLESRIGETEIPHYQELHRSIVSALVSDHRRLLEVLRKKLETELAAARIQLAELKDPTTLDAILDHQRKDLAEKKSQLAKLTDPEIFGTKLRAQENIIRQKENDLLSLKDAQKVLEDKLAHISAQQDLVRKEIQALEKRIADALELQLHATSGIKDASSAMSQLLINNQISSDRKWLVRLREQLHIELENRRAEIEKALKDNARSQQLAQAQIEQAKGVLQALRKTNLLEQMRLKAAIAEIESTIQKLINDQQRKIQRQQENVAELLNRLDNFVETRAVVPPTRSPEPVSLSKKTQVLLLIFLGVIFALFAVLIAEFRDRVHAKETQISP